MGKEDSWNLRELELFAANVGNASRNVRLEGARVRPMCSALREKCELKVLKNRDPYLWLET